VPKSECRGTEMLEISESGDWGVICARVPGHAFSGNLELRRLGLPNTVADAGLIPRSLAIATNCLRPIKGTLEHTVNQSSRINSITIVLKHSLIFTCRAPPARFLALGSAFVFAGISSLVNSKWFCTLSFVVFSPTSFIQVEWLSDIAGMSNSSVQ
jgi:hypothetical protein